MKKKKGRYVQAEPNTAKRRKYISYEDEPLRENENIEPTPQNLTKRFLKVFGILFLAVVAVLALINIDYLTPENISHWFQYELLGKTEGNGYPVRFSGISVDTENFALMDVLPVYCSDTSVVVMNSNAGEYQNTQHSYANPVLRTNSGCALVFNSDATGFRIINRDSTVYTGSADKKLFDADIASNGTYALLSYGVDYLSTLNVYKSDNSKKYSYSFADYYVNKVSLNSNGSKAALSGVSAKNGGLISAIYILDFNQENYLQKYEVEDAYIYDLHYTENGNVYAVGNNGAYFINIEKNEKTDISYESKTLTAYDLRSDDGLILSLSSNPDGRDCDIQVFDNDGKQKAYHKTNSRVISVDGRYDRFAVLTPNLVGIYDMNGNNLTNVTVAADARKICFLDNHTIYVLGKSEISKLAIEY